MRIGFDIAVRRATQYIALHPILKRLDIFSNPLEEEELMIERWMPWEEMTCRELTEALVEKGCPRKQAAEMTLRRDRQQMKFAINAWLMKE